MVPTAMTLQTDPPTIPLLVLGRIGGIGFQYTGGIITVVATYPKVTLNFDRPMVYNGDYVDNVNGNPFSIAAPALAVDTRSIDVPIAVHSVPSAVTGAEVAEYNRSTAPVGGEVVNMSVPDAPTGGEAVSA
jgi:hypothetical protein